eukprot:614454-Amphidinium_carterae.2
MDEEYNVPDTVRLQQARERQERREERKGGRFRGTLEELTRMRDTLRDIIITGRKQRLQARVPAPKAAPAGIQLPYHHKPLNELTIQELRAKIRHEEERAERGRAGAYAAPTIPGIQQYRDRLDILETQAQEEEEDRRERLRAQELRVQLQEEEQKEDDLQQNLQRKRNKHEIKKNLTDRQRIQ